MEVVFDTNVLASIAITPNGSKLYQIAQFWQGDLFTVYISEPILTELERTLLTIPYFQSRITPEQVQSYLFLVRSTTTEVTLRSRLDHNQLREEYGGMFNPEDDLILATAIDAAAKYLVTGDKLLAKLWRYEDVFIVSPADFLELIDRK